MPSRLLSKDLIPELTSPAARGLLIMYLDMCLSRVDLVAAYRDRGFASVTLFDALVIQYIFTLRESGTRQADLVNAIQAPRRTIRDSLARSRSAGLLIRDDDGVYYPSTLVAPIANESWFNVLRKIRRVCEADAEYRKATDRA